MLEFDTSTFIQSRSFMHKVEDTVCHLFDTQRQSFLAKKTKAFSEYMQTLTSCCLDNCFVSFTGWHNPLSIQNLLAPHSKTHQEGGYFFRFNGKGICINPGNHFFERFTNAGFHLWHIDTVLVTSPDNRHLQDLELLYECNRALNQTLIAHGQDPHVIEYLLHPQAYSQYSAKLRPFFRQEKESITCLETFDSYEQLQICDDIALVYKNSAHCIPCRFELQNGLTFGYSATGKDLELFTPCKMIITQYSDTVGSTPFTNAELVLLSEFSLSDGDTRLEAAKQCRIYQRNATVLPLENGIEISLEHLGVRQNRAHSFHIPRQSVQIVREMDFQRLIYTSNGQTL